MAEETKELTIESVFQEAVKPASPEGETKVNEEKKEGDVGGNVESGSQEQSVAEKYTDDEFKELGYDQIDPLRVPDSMRYVYEVVREKVKNLEKAYNEKYMSLAEERKRLKSTAQDRIPTTPEEKEKWLFDQYEKNPQATTQDLDNSIFNLKQNLEMLKLDVISDPFAENIEEKKRALYNQQNSLIELEKYQRKLGSYVSNRENYMKSQQEVVKMETAVAEEVINDIRKTFPEFDKKRDDINNFSMKKLGFTNDQIKYFTNPVRLSLTNRIPLDEAKTLAKNVFNTIFKLYNYENMVNEGKNKIKQTPPTPLTKAGAKEVPEQELTTYDSLDKYLTAKGV